MDLIIPYPECEAPMSSLPQVKINKGRKANMMSAMVQTLLMMARVDAIHARIGTHQYRMTRTWVDATRIETEVEVTIERAFDPDKFPKGSFLHYVNVDGDEPSISAASLQPGLKIRTSAWVESGK